MPNLKVKIAVVAVIIGSLTCAFVNVANAEGTPKFSFTLEEGTSKTYPNIKPGDKIDGEMAITLQDDVVADFEISFGGEGSLYTDEKSPLNMSNWLTFPEGKLVHIDGTPSGLQTVSIPFKIIFPKNMSPGDYVGQMAATLISSSDSARGSTGVKMSAAIGMNLIFSVSGKRVNNLVLKGIISNGFSPSGDDKKPDDKELVLRVNVANNGNSIIRPFAHVTATNLFGKKVYDIKSSLTDLMPGQEASPAVTIKGVDKNYGWLDVSITISYSAISISGEVGKDVFQAGHGSLRVYIIPVLGIAVILIVLLVIIFILIIKKLRIKRLMMRSSDYVVQQNDTLQSVCTALMANPKDVILVNKLPLPYFLVPGDHILIPK